jgi:HSP20 family molecular chaperone IbpA
MMYATKRTTRVFATGDEIGRLIENVAALHRAGYADWNPAVDVTETNEALTFAVELPGLTEKDVDVSAANGILTVRGDRTTTRKEGEESRFHLSERRYGTFLRRFQLPSGVDTSKIEAKLESGMLEVSVPCTALPEPTRIQIQTVAEPYAAVPTAPVRGAVAAAALPARESAHHANGKQGRK